jgi:hypothetical protein
MRHVPLGGLAGIFRSGGFPLCADQYIAPRNCNARPWVDAYQPSFRVRVLAANYRALSEFLHDAGLLPAASGDRWAAHSSE